jgi:multidrug efflux pump subunit AcrA (membrane-fusion protein)
MPPKPIDQTELDEAAWSEIERLIRDIADSARSGVSVADFYQHLLDRTVTATAAVGGAVWLRDAAGRFHLEYQINLESTGLVDCETARADHGRLLGTVVRDDQARSVPPRSGQQGGHDSENQTGLLLMLCPVRFEGESMGVVEIFQRPSIHPATQRGNLRLLTMVAELAADFHRSRAFRELSDREAAARQLDQFARSVHRSLDLRLTAYAIANEGRQVLGCDRVSVAVPAGSRYRLLAVSGVDVFDRRANAVRQIERLTSLVAATGEPLWYADDTSGLAPQIEDVLQSYVNDSHARTLIVVPLTHAEREENPPTVTGALIVEQFQAVPDKSLAPRLDSVCQHASVALGNAAAYGSIPLLPMARSLGWAGRLFGPRHLPKTAVAILGVVLAVAALTFIPARFTVKVRGELQPLGRYHVFVPHDGVVSEIMVEHDDLVSGGDVLALLRSPELALAIQEVQGESDQARQRLLAVAAEKLRATRDARDADVLSQLTSQETQLKELIATRERELAILREQRESLTVRSPIDGRVLTWKTEQLLAGRPVRKGQVLMTVADVEGPWILELHVPDDQIGHVLAGRAESGGEQSVSFILATMPGVKHRGRIRKVAGAVSTSREEGLSVLVTVDVDRDAVALLRPGASVAARIDCGRRPIGYVWLHGVFEAIQKHLLF